MPRKRCGVRSVVDTVSAVFGGGGGGLWWSVVERGIEQRLDLHSIEWIEIPSNTNSEMRKRSQSLPTVCRR